jgi:hypothetical protein
MNQYKQPAYFENEDGCQYEFPPDSRTDARNASLLLMKEQFTPVSTFTLNDYAFLRLEFREIDQQTSHTIRLVWGNAYTSSDFYERSPDKFNNRYFFVHGITHETDWKQPEDELIGYYHIAESINEVPSYGRIVYVQVKKFNHGFGSLLLTHAFLELLNSEHIGYITLDVTHENTRIFFENRGLYDAALQSDQSSNLLIPCRSPEQKAELITLMKTNIVRGKFQKRFPNFQAQDLGSI